ARHLIARAVVALTVILVLAGRRSHGRNFVGGYQDCGFASGNVNVVKVSFAPALSIAGDFLMQYIGNFFAVRAPLNCVRSASGNAVRSVNGFNGQFLGAQNRRGKSSEASSEQEPFHRRSPAVKCKDETEKCTRKGDFSYCLNARRDSLYFSR